MTESLVLSLLGGLVGLALGVVGIRVTPRDPLVFVVVPLVLAIFAWLGVWLPARRAGRVDPMVALRVD
jgi:ABC-type antimicrobial peptide transport system permease subunit